MTEQIIPWRMLDRSGRSLYWVKIASPEHQTAKTAAELTTIELCPRSEKGQPPDILTRTCHSEDSVWFRASQEVHDSIEDMGFKYQFEYRFADRGLGWYVGFLRSDEAALVKLRWGL